MGFALSATPAELGQFVSYFVVVNVLSPDDPLFMGIAPPSSPEETVSPFGPASGASAMSGYATDTVAQPKPKETEPPVPFDPCQGCENDYARAMADATRAKECADTNARTDYANAEASAKAAYDIAVNSARDARNIAATQALSARDITVATARATYDSSNTTAVQTYIALAIGCGVGGAIPIVGGATALVCVGAAYAALIITQQGLIADYNAAVRAANATYTAAMAAAEAAFKSAIATAVATRDEAFASAQRARDAALAAAQCAFDQAAAAAAAARDACREANECSVQ